jgi:hypothetical protein
MPESSKGVGERTVKPARIFAFISVVSLCLAVGTRAAQSPEPINSDALARIKLEASRGSQLMEVARNITTVSGPRTTNSPNIRTAGTFALKTLADWKLNDVHYETWTFGNGWTSDRFSIKVDSDPTMTLLAYSKPWTPGTNGPVTAEAVEAIIRTDADFARLRGTLKGKFVMILPGPTTPPPTPPALPRSDGSQTTNSRRWFRDPPCNLPLQPQRLLPLQHRGRPRRQRQLRRLPQLLNPRRDSLPGLKMRWPLLQRNLRVR